MVLTVTDKEDNSLKAITSKVNLGGTEIAGAEIKIFKGYKAECGYSCRKLTSEANKSKEINWHQALIPSMRKPLQPVTLKLLISLSKSTMTEQWKLPMLVRKTLRAKRTMS